MKKLSKVVKIRTYPNASTSVLAVPTKLLEKLCGDLSPQGISEYWRVSLEHGALVYRPIIFSAQNGCPVCDHKEINL